MAEKINETANETIQPVTVDAALDLLRGIFDPELQYNIVDLGLIYDLKIEGSVAKVKMTLTTPACPYGPMLIEQVRLLLPTIQGIKEARIELVWEPPWSPQRMTEEARLELGFDI